METAVMISRVFLWLMTYSFLGWVYESTLCSVTQRKLVNRGFLNGPFCPIYGFGALLILLVFGGRKVGLAELFLASAVLTTTLEYITSWAMEQLFHARWWDYTHYRFQLNGRVCLLGFLAFGAFSVVLIRWLHPLVGGLIDRLSGGWMIGLAAVLLALVIIDSIFTVRNILRLNHKLEEIQVALDGFRSEWKQKLEERLEAPKERVARLREQFESSRFYTERVQSLLNRHKAQDKRLLRAFPRLTSTRYQEALESLRERLRSKKGKSQK